MADLSGNCQIIVFKNPGDTLALFCGESTTPQGEWAFFERSGKLGDFSRWDRFIDNRISDRLNW
jgi:hypothetical protein